MSVLQWQRPTSWSAETTDGRWYAEKVKPRGWTIALLRGRGKKPHGRFPSLAKAKVFAESAEAIKRIAREQQAALERLAQK